MSRLQWQFLATVAVLALAPRTARAQAESRVALAVADAQLAAGLAVILSPLGVEVLEIPALSDSTINSDYSGELAAVRARAERYDATAIVWIERFGDAYLLSTFVSDSGSMLTRPLTDGPPYDAATATAVAFSIKTLLREGGVIRDSGAAAPEATALPAPARAASEAASTDAAVEPRTDSVDALELPEPEAASHDDSPAFADAATRAGERRQRAVPAQMDHGRIWLEPESAVVLAFVPGDRGFRAGATGTLWVGGVGGHLGMAGGLSWLSPRELEAGNDRGQVSAFEAAVRVRLRRAIVRDVAVAYELGGALRAMNLRAEADTGGESLSERRISAVAEAGISLLFFATERFALAISIRGGLLVRPVDYTWEGALLFSESRLRAEVGLRLVLAL